MRWWINACLFDFIIGNSDRHHENWGVLKTSDGCYKMAPLFDNGVAFDFHLKECDLKHMYNFIDTRVKYLKEYKQVICKAKKLYQILLNQDSCI